MDDNYNHLLAKSAPIAGALISLNFVKGTWVERLSMFASGALLSYYASPFAAIWTGLPEGITGFGLGLFGMTIASKGYEVIQGLPIKEFWAGILRRFGL